MLTKILLTIGFAVLGYFIQSNLQNGDAVNRISVIGFLGILGYFFGYGLAKFLSNFANHRYQIVGEKHPLSAFADGKTYLVKDADFNIIYITGDLKIFTKKEKILDIAYDDDPHFSIHRPVSDGSLLGIFSDFSHFGKKILIGIPFGSIRTGSVETFTVHRIIES